MSIGEHISQFAGRSVVDFEAGKPIQPGGAFAYRLSVDYDDYYDSQSQAGTPEPAGGLWQSITGIFGKGKPAPEPEAAEQSAFQKLWQAFLADPNAASVEALVLADWGGGGEGSTAAEVVVSLVAARPQLPALNALFIGEMVMEESEISWIQQADLSPVLAAYRGLEHFQVRGGEGLSLGSLAAPNLETLILESGGLPVEVVEQVCNGDLPALQHLELWLGSDNYGGSSGLDDLVPILSGEAFPHLQYLGLRNCEFADQLAAAVAASPVVESLKILDLSLGNMTDEGGKALLASPVLKGLAKLDLHHHFLSDGVMAQFDQLPITVDVSIQEAAEDDDGEVYRYIAVSE